MEGERSELQYQIAERLSAGPLNLDPLPGSDIRSFLPGKGGGGDAVRTFGTSINTNNWRDADDNQTVQFWGSRGGGRLVHFEMLRKLAGESDDTASVNAAS